MNLRYTGNSCSIETEGVDHSFFPDGSLGLVVAVELSIIQWKVLTCESCSSIFERTWLTWHTYSDFVQRWPGIWYPNVHGNAFPQRATVCVSAAILPRKVEMGAIETPIQKPTISTRHTWYSLFLHGVPCSLFNSPLTISYIGADRALDGLLMGNNGTGLS